MKLAVIGASTGQLPLCLKAREMGIETICFAWEQGAVCRDRVDRFYPVSVLEKERILEICRKERVDGIVTNASDLLAEIAAYIAERMDLPGNSYRAMTAIKRKSQVRKACRTIPGLAPVECRLFRGERPDRYPCIVKPETGAAKKGVSFVENAADFDKAIAYALEANDRILIEEYVEGRELSVEALSCNGIHYIIQLTDKENSGPPHFVELGHHQPANLPSETAGRIGRIVPEILDRIDLRNGASHTELKIDADGNIRLIEVNPRGGGDHISSTLVYESTGFDYLRGMIEVALGIFQAPKIARTNHAGIYYLCAQTEHLLPLFRSAAGKPWLVEAEWHEGPLEPATGNYDRNGYLIYRSDRKIDCGHE